MSGGGVTPSPTPSVSDTFFWRYDELGDATWLVNSQGQLVKAKQQVGVDDVSIGYIRNTGGDSVDIEATTLVTEQWGEQRAEFNGSPDADWSITMDGETLSYNGVLTPSVAEWAWLEIFADENCTELPQGNPTTVYAMLKKQLTNNVTVPPDSGSALRIIMPVEPGDYYSIIWGSEWMYESQDAPDVGVLTLVTANPNPISVEGIQTKFY